MAHYDAHVQDYLKSIFLPVFLIKLDLRLFYLMKKLAKNTVVESTSPSDVSCDVLPIVEVEMLLSKLVEGDGLGFVLARGFLVLQVIVGMSYLVFCGECNYDHAVVCFPSIFGRSFHQRKLYLLLPPRDGGVHGVRGKALRDDGEVLNVHDVGLHDDNDLQIETHDYYDVLHDLRDSGGDQNRDVHRIHHVLGVCYNHDALVDDVCCACPAHGVRDGVVVSYSEL